MHATPGRSLTDIFESQKAGRVNPERDHVLIGKERHDIGRPEDRGYPVRGIVADDVLYLKNFEPDRWPAGHPETGYLNCDASPTKTLILENRTAPGMGRFWELSFGKRPTEQLYRLRRDPHCINNLAEAPRYAGLKERLRKRLFEKLEEQGDPRMHGNGEVFDNYPYANESDRNFYERFMAGELDRGAAGWVNPSDFEDEPLD